MDYLVFGGFGYIGSRIVDFLNKESNKITIASNSQHFLSSSLIETISNYRSMDDNQLIKLISKYDVIIDATGLSGEQLSKNSILDVIKINSEWPIRLARICLKCNIKFYWFSSIHCQEFEINNPFSLRDNLYPISKLIAESTIMEIENWDNLIAIIRLGNMIGTPGYNYKGHSNLFALDIAKSLVTKNKALIKSNPNKNISLIPISDLLTDEIFSFSGFKTLYSQNQYSLFIIAKYILNVYEKVSGNKGNLEFNNYTQNNCENKFLSEKIKKEINMMVNFYFLKYNSTKTY